MTDHEDDDAEVPTIEDLFAAFALMGAVAREGIIPVRRDAATTATQCYDLAEAMVSEKVRRRG